jgi:hypothetical protein
MPAPGAGRPAITNPVVGCPLERAQVPYRMEEDLAFARGSRQEQDGPSDAATAASWPSRERPFELNATAGVPR